MSAALHKMAFADSTPADDCFLDHRVAALTLMLTEARLTAKQGRFLGCIAYCDVIQPRQLRGLNVMLQRHGLPPMIGGLA